MPSNFIIKKNFTRSMATYRGRSEIINKTKSNWNDVDLTLRCYQTNFFIDFYSMQNRLRFWWNSYNGMY